MSDILTNAKFNEKIGELITEIKKGIGNADLFQKVGDEEIKYGQGDCSSAINELGEQMGGMSSRLPSIRQVYKNVSVDEYGYAYIGSKSDFPWVLSIAISSSFQDRIVDKFYVNEYGLWYIKVVDHLDNIVQNENLYVIIIVADE